MGGGETICNENIFAELYCRIETRQNINLNEFFLPRDVKLESSIHPCYLTSLIIFILCLPISVLGGYLKNKKIHPLRAGDSISSRSQWKNQWAVHCAFDKKTSPWFPIALKILKVFILLSNTDEMKWEFPSMVMSKFLPLTLLARMIREFYELHRK